MNYCNTCGIELDDDLQVCPLCGKNPADPGEHEPVQSNYPSDIIHIYRKESRRQIWELSGIIAFSGMAVYTIVDLVVGKGLKWSLFADVSILSGWICLTLLLLAFRKYFITIPGLMATLLIMLLFFDFVSPETNWFLPVGLPITVAVFISLSIIILLWKIAHFKGFNILAIVFLVISGFCIVVETFIDKYLFGSVEIRWSAIAAVSILPIALVLLFVHYRMKKGKRLDSYFHI